MSTSRHIRLALLICDTPNPLVLAAHGDYLAIFRDLLARSLALTPYAAAGVTFELDGFDVRKGQFPPEEMLAEGKEGAYEGILITGSAATSYDDEQYPWILPAVKFLRQLGDKHSHVRIVAICFGLQLLVRAYGGEVCRNPKGWEIGTYALDLTPAGQALLPPLSTESPAASASTLNIQQMHADHAAAIPPEGGPWELLASTAKSSVHGFFRRRDEGKGKVGLLAVQGHPEFTPSITNKIIDVRSEAGIFTPEMTAEARDRAVKEDDGAGRFGRVMWRVLLDDAEV